MRQIITLTLLLTASLFLQGCLKANENTSYRISGTFFNATTNKPYKGLKLTFVRPAYGGGLFSSHVSTMEVAAIKTDSNGYYELNYKYLEGHSIRLESNLVNYEFPINQTIARNFTISDSGTLKIYLKTDNLLESTHDTLFIATYGRQIDFLTREILIDTILASRNGLYRSLRLPRTDYRIHYGRGSRDLHYNIQTKQFTPETHYLIPHVEDPDIKEVTINY